MIVSMSQMWRVSWAVMVQPRLLPELVLSSPALGLGLGLLSLHVSRPSNNRPRDEDTGPVPSLGLRSKTTAFVSGVLETVKGLKPVDAGLLPGYRRGIRGK